MGQFQDRSAAPRLTNTMWPPELVGDRDYLIVPPQQIDERPDPLGVPLTLMAFRRSPCDSNDSSVPLTTIRPLLTMMASLHTFSTSCRMWDETRTDLSEAAIRAMRFNIPPAVGVHTLVGSSRNSISGS